MSKPWADFETRIYDIATGETVWVASSHTGGNAFADLGTVVDSFGRRVALKLTEDGVIGTE